MSIFTMGILAIIVGTSPQFGWPEYSATILAILFGIGAATTLLEIGRRERR
jgi:hypothetical protein